MTDWTDTLSITLDISVRISLQSTSLRSMLVDAPGGSLAGVEVEGSLMARVTGGNGRVTGANGRVTGVGGSVAGTDVIFPDSTVTVFDPINLLMMTA